jgi:CheY-like chemotaxis protein
MIVLVVEDEALQSMLLKAVLEEAGHEIRGPAATAGHALELAERMPTPEVALVDINLADGRGTGLELARQLLEHTILPVFVSGQVMEARENQDVAMGILKKPYRLDAVLRTLRMIKAVRAGYEEVVGPPEFDLFEDPLTCDPRDPASSRV